VEAWFTVEGVLSPAECGQWIELGESMGFEAAPITTAIGFEMMPEVRNNTRVMFDDPVRAEALWLRVRAQVAERGAVVSRGAAYEPMALNERLRLYRYRSDQYFDWHSDGAFVRNDKERSFLTAMFYLNGDFAGGTTDFELEEDDFSITPKPGLALFFEHPLLHRGAPVLSGTKYVLRTDVMYRRARAR
jgi:prolyl 4-hydroxylase